MSSLPKNRNDEIRMGFRPSTVSLSQGIQDMIIDDDWRYGTHGFLMSRLSRTEAFDNEERSAGTVVWMGETLHWTIDENRENPISIKLSWEV